MDGRYWKGDRTMSTNEWLLTSDFDSFLNWHGRWYEYKIFIASCTDNIYDLENERWLLGDMIDHVGIYGSRVAEGLSASNVGLVMKYNKREYFQHQCDSVNVKCENQMYWIFFHIISHGLAEWSHTTRYSNFVIRHHFLQFPVEC